MNQIVFCDQNSRQARKSGFLIFSLEEDGERKNPGLYTSQMQTNTDIQRLCGSDGGFCGSIHSRGTLATSPHFPRRSWKRKPDRVTIIIGMKFGGGIVMACDSRTTQESGLVKDDAEKMSIAKFSNGKVLVAHSGSVAFGSRAARLFSEMASHIAIESDYTVSQTLQRAVLQTLEEIFLPFKQSQFSQAEVDQKIRDNRFSLMIAFYLQNKPYLFTIESERAAPVEVSNTAAIGCGAEVAEFIMKWFPFPQMDVLYSSIAATYVVQEVIHANSFCGPPVRIAAVTTKGHIGLQPEATTAEIYRALRKKRAGNMQAWGDQMKAMLIDILKTKPTQGAGKGMDFMKIH